MQEDYNKWLLDCGDIGEFEISNKQLNFILECEKQKVRFVQLENVGINIAFIRSWRKIRQTTNLLPDMSNSQDIKELTEEERIKLRDRLRNIKNTFKSI